MNQNNNLVEIDYTKKNSIIKTRLNVFVDDNTINSSNPTFDKSIHTPYITNVKIFNKNGECIMKASFSKPILADKDLYFIFEHITV